jgi:hypothetical protein
VVTGIGDDLEALAELERVGRERHVARRGVGNAGYPLDGARRRGRLVDGELVALADEAGIVLQPVEQRGHREHRQDHAARNSEHRHSGEHAPAASGREPHSQPDEARGKARAARRRREVATAQHVHQRPARGAPGRQRGRAPHQQDDHEQRKRERRDQSATGRELVEALQQPRRRAV